MTWNTDLSALDEGTPACITIQRADGTRAMTRAWKHVFGSGFDGPDHEPGVTWSIPEDETFGSLVNEGDQVIAWHPDENAVENGLVPYDPAKPVTTKERAMLARSRVLQKLQQAQTLILEARELASPLEGWADEEPRGPYYLLGDHHDATKALWHTINNAPEPTGYWTV